MLIFIQIDAQPHINKKGGWNPQHLQKVQGNITKGTTTLSTLIWKDSSELANKHIDNSNPSLDKVL